MSLRLLILSTQSSGGAAGDKMFITKSMSGLLSIASGAAVGTILTITPPAGQRIRLSSLFVKSGSGAQTDITVNVGGSALISSSTMANPQAGGVGEFNIAHTVDGIGAAFGMGMASPALIAGVDEVITVVKGTANTTADILYNFEYGILE